MHAVEDRPEQKRAEARLSSAQRGGRLLRASSLLQMLARKGIWGLRRAQTIRAVTRSDGSCPAWSRRHGAENLQLLSYSYPRVCAQPKSRMAFLCVVACFSCPCASPHDVQEPPSPFQPSRRQPDLSSVPCSSAAAYSPPSASPSTHFTKRHGVGPARAQQGGAGQGRGPGCPRPTNHQLSLSGKVLKDTSGADVPRQVSGSVPQAVV